MTQQQKVALITRVTGHEDTYLAELPLNEGYEVHGIKRRASPFNTDRVDHLTPFSELVREMVGSDCSAARHDSLIKLAGFQAYDHSE